MKKIQTRLIVISLLIIAISLAVIAFRPVIKDIRSFIRIQRIQREYEPRLQEDIVDQWLEKQR